MIRFLQINLNHSKKASDALILRLSKNAEDIILIQEPWIAEGVVRGLRTPVYTPLYTRDKGKIRTCILVKRSLNVFLLSNLSDPDLTVARLETAKGSYWLASAYLGHDHVDPPPGDKLERVVLEAGSQKIGLIIECNANAHHTVWGSTDINDRGESL